MVEAIAKMDHFTTDKDFLSFNKGDVLKITEMDVQIEHTFWFRAYLNGKRGLVSDTMLDIKPYKWYWAGYMTRFQAETELLEKRIEQFLIRRTSIKNFYLSYRSKTHENKVWHFAIEFNQENVTFSLFNDWNGVKRIFFSLTELVHCIKVSGTHMYIRWTPAPDEDEVLAQRKERCIRWSPN